MTLHDWALFYEGAGWNIFPLLPKSKVPHEDLLRQAGMVRDDGRGSWKPLQSKKINEDIVNFWWEKEPNANIALVCGFPSRVTVIDIDTHKQGCASKKGQTCDCKAIDVAEIAKNLCPMTMQSRTGSGGIHLICKYAPGVGGSVRGVHDQVDIKNDGGYIVLPPSVHDKTHNLYKWHDFFTFNEENLDALDDYPKRLKEIEKEREEMTNGDWAQLLTGIKEGGRNHATAQVVGKLLRAVVVEFNADKEIIHALWELTRAWNTLNEPPLDEKELMHTFKSIVKRATYGAR